MAIRIAFALAFFASLALRADASFAEGAIAVGMPEGDPRNGFRHIQIVNNRDAAAEAMRDCRAARNPKTGAACILIGTFSNQCVAVAVNGDAVDTDASVIAGGWAVAPDSSEAERRAIAQCEAMRKGRKERCEIEGKVLCDGSAQ